MLHLALRRAKLAPFLLKAVEHRWRIVFFILVTILVGFAIQEGFEHAQVNQFRDQSVQLPILYSYADQDLFPNDLLLEARVTYVTWFYPALGYLSRYLPLYVLMLGLYILSVGLTISAVYYLAEDLFPTRSVGIIAVILWAAWMPNPGGDFLRSAFPTHTTTAVGLQLWALVFALRKRETLAALILGFSININAMTGVFIAFVWAFSLLSDRQNWTWKTLRIPFLIGLMALPTLWWKFGMGATHQDIPMEDFVGIMRTRLWYAIFPFSVDRLLWLSFAGVLGMWWYSARYADPLTNRKVFWMMQGIVLLVIIGTVFTELYPVELVMQLQLLRSTWVLNLFAMLYIANMIRELLRGSRAQTYLAVFITASLALPRLIMELIPLPNPVPYALYVDLNPVRADSPWEGVVILIGLTLSLAFVLWQLIPQTDLRFSKRMMNWFVFAVIIFAAPMFVNTAIPAEQATLTDDWEEALFWVRDHTPKDASFITPPTLDGFRVEAERTQFSDWKDGTLLIFNSELAEEWLYRMEAMGFNQAEFRFEDPTQAQLCRIARDYDMDYALVLKTWQIQGEAVFENNHFAIFPTETMPCADF